MAKPLFFLSYARADDDGYVEKFYRDFATEVRLQSGQRREDIGFRDIVSLQPGSLWRDTLTEALGKAGTFLALCSPTYYASEACGKEWSVFRSRLERYRSEHGVYPARLLPIIWVPGAHPPDAVQAVQHNHEDLGALYHREGLQFLLRLNRYRDQYNEILIRLARRVVALVDEFDLPEPSEPVDLDVVGSAFLHPPPALPARPTDARTTSFALARPAPVVQSVALGQQQVRGGPGHVNFVVAAGTREAMRPHRHHLHHYGEATYDWAPYRPELEQRICVFAQTVASSQNLTSGVAPTGELRALLDRATESNEIVVLLIDAWATKIDSFRQALAEYDRRNEPTSPVMVPWSSSDQENVARTDELRSELYRTLTRNFQRGDALVRTEISNPAAFQIALEEALVEAQSRVFRFGRVVRRAGGDTRTERPILGIPEKGIDS